MSELKRRAFRAGYRFFQIALPTVVVPVGIQKATRKVLEVMGCVDPLPQGMEITTKLALIFDGGAVLRVLADRERFDVSEYDAKMQETFGRFLLGLDLEREPDGAEYREQVRLLRNAIEPGDRQRVEQIARAAANAAVIEQAARGNGALNTIDVVPMTESVLSTFVEQYFGIPPVKGARNLTQLNQATASYVFSPKVFTGQYRGQAEEAGRLIRAHIAKVVEERRTNPPAEPKTIVDRLIRDCDDDERICTILGGTTSGLFVPTTLQFLAVVDRLLDLPARDRDAVHALALERRDGREVLMPPQRDPKKAEDDAKKLASPEADDRRLQHFVVEAARFKPFPPGLIRHAKEDRELEIGRGRKRTVPGNSTVVALTASAVVDPTLVPHPGEFLIGRPPTQQFIFGTGQHQCTGGTLQRPIAQMLMTEMTAALFALPNLKRAPGKSGKIQNEGRWPAHFQVVGEAGNA